MIFSSLRETLLKITDYFIIRYYTLMLKVVYLWKF